jgi:hypothetical protein
MITLAQAKALKSGDILLDKHQRRWKVNGSVKLWKTDPSRIRVPLKHGLYSYDAITTDMFDENNECHDLSMEAADTGDMGPHRG